MVSMWEWYQVAWMVYGLVASMVDETVACLVYEKENAMAEMLDDQLVLPKDDWLVYDVDANADKSWAVGSVDEMVFFLADEWVCQWAFSLGCPQAALTAGQ
jgi:hypothetical protein